MSVYFIFKYGARNIKHYWSWKKPKCRNVKVPKCQCNKVKKCPAEQNKTKTKTRTKLKTKNTKKNKIQREGWKVKNAEKKEKKVQAFFKSLQFPHRRLLLIASIFELFLIATNLFFYFFRRFFFISAYNLELVFIASVSISAFFFSVGVCHVFSFTFFRFFNSA